MADRGDKRMGTYHHVVADADLSDVEDGEVVVAGEIVPDEDVPAAVTVERLGNPDPLTDASEHPCKLFILGRVVGPVDCVEPFALPDRGRLAGHHLWVVEAVRESRVAFLEFCHIHTFLMTQVTTPQMRKSLSGPTGMGLYLVFFSLQGRRTAPSSWISTRLTVYSPSMKHTALQLLYGSIPRSTMMISPSSMSASTIEMPSMRKKKVEALCCTRSFTRSNFSLTSSAGEGKPALTAPAKASSRESLSVMGWGIIGTKIIRDCANW